MGPDYTAVVRGAKSCRCFPGLSVKKSPRELGTTDGYPSPSLQGRIQLRLRNSLAPWPGLGWGEGRCSEVLSDSEQVGPVKMQVLEKGTGPACVRVLPWEPSPSMAQTRGHLVNSLGMVVTAGWSHPVNGGDILESVG